MSITILTIHIPFKVIQYTKTDNLRRISIRNIIRIILDDQDF